MKQRGTWSIVHTTRNPDLSRIEDLKQRNRRMCSFALADGTIISVLNVAHLTINHSKHSVTFVGQACLGENDTFIHVSVAYTYATRHRVGLIKQIFPVA